MSKPSAEIIISGGSGGADNSASSKVTSKELDKSLEDQRTCTKILLHRDDYQDDNFDYFGKYVGKALSRVPDNWQRLYAKNLINWALHYAQENRLTSISVIQK